MPKRNKLFSATFQLLWLCNNHPRAWWDKTAIYHNQGLMVRNLEGEHEGQFVFVLNVVKEDTKFGSWIIWRFHSLKGVWCWWLEACILLHLGSPGGLSIWDSLGFLTATAKFQGQTSQEWEKTRIMVIFSDLALEVTRITFTIFYWLKQLPDPGQTHDQSIFTLPPLCEKM